MTSHSEALSSTERMWIDPTKEFERFATTHAAHNHCQGCGCCLLDPSHIVQSFAAWCVACVDRIKASLAPGVKPPWHRLGGWEFPR